MSQIISHVGTHDTEHGSKGTDASVTLVMRGAVPSTITNGGGGQGLIGAKVIPDQADSVLFSPLVYAIGLLW